VAVVISQGIRICLLGLGFIAQISAQALPEGKGREQLERICGNCHGIDRVTASRMTASQWTAVVDDMVSRGADGTDDEFALIVNYLSTNFGPKPDSDSKSAAGQKINVNTASAHELVDALALSNSDAEAIVQYRKDKGAFKDWPDLRKVPGIDQKKLADQKDRIVFSADHSENSK
jgi:competence protein ComEA